MPGGGEDLVMRRVEGQRKDAWEFGGTSNTNAPLHLLATVTFNSNKLRAHLLPLISLDEVGSITLVADDYPAAPLPKVRALVPTRTERRVLGRAGAKLSLCLRLARRHHFDWILGFNFVPHGFNAQLVARSAGTRSLYHMIGGEREWVGGGHSSDNKVLGQLPRAVPALEWLMLHEMRKATLVATMGPRGRESLLGRGFASERVVVVPPCTDIERFAPKAPANRSFDVVAVGSLLENKRLSDLIDAVAILSERHPAIRVGVIGDGPLRNALEERARERRVERLVVFAGHLAAIEDVYAGVTAFVLCSHFEGMPVSMLDAMSAGLVPVVTDVGEISTLVVPGRNGLLYRTGDVAELARSIDSVVSNRDYARRLGAQARQDVIRRHSVQAVAATYGRLFRGQHKL